jgi:hypothetical protein
MKNKFTLRIRSACVTLLMLFALSAWADDTYTSNDGWKYTVSDDKVTITGYTGSSTSLEIPSTLGEYSVTSIGESAFEENTSITSVTIPETVTSIGVKAFRLCKALESVSIPTTVTTIGQEAFTGSAITNIEATSVTSLGYHTFGDCSSLKKANFPKVTSVGNRAFYNTPSLEVVILSNSVDVDGAAFYCASSSMNVILQDDNEYLYKLDTENKTASLYDRVINNSADDYAKVLMSVTYSKETYNVNSIKYKDGEKFCYNLDPTTKEASLCSGYDGDYNKPYFGGGSVTFFSGTDDEIKYTVTSIEDGAFQNYTRFNLLGIPLSVKKIGSKAFVGCSNVTTLQVAIDAEIASDAFEGLTIKDYYVGDKKAGLYYKLNVDDANPTAVVSFCIWSDDVTDVIIPESITYMTVEYKITDIEEYALNNGYSTIKSLSIKPDLEEVKALFDSYHKSTALKSITFPDNVEVINSENFYRTEALSEINISSDNSNFKVVDNVLYNPGGTTLLHCPRGKTSISISESVTVIADSAFYSCTNLTSVEFPENSKVTTIGNRSFSGCSGITSITIPSTVTSLGDYCLTSTGIKTITLPASITNMGTYVFSYCSSLETPDLSALTITDLPDYTFWGCSNLMEVKFPANIKSIGKYVFSSCKNKLTSMVIPSTVESIGAYAFRECTILTSVDFSKTAIKELPNPTFYMCYKLNDVKLPPNLETLDNNVFDDCAKLLSIEIPASVTTMGDFVRNAQNINTIKCLGTVPPATFSGQSYTKLKECTIYVPADYAYEYRNADVWKDCSKIYYLPNYSRTTAEGKFGTICLPYEYTVEGANLYSVESIGSDKVELTKVEKATANVAYIYQATANEQTFKYNESNYVSGDPKEGYLVGASYDNTTYAPLGSYVLQTQPGNDDNAGVQAFYKVESADEIHIKPHRAYLDATYGSTSAETDSDEMSALRITFADEASTGVEAVRSIVNGENPVIYDLNGRRRSTLQKGVNIVNGVKVYVK